MSDIKHISNFTNSLEKDLGTIENVVSSPLSKGFVEGMNNKVEMVKRTMYGRCGCKLLATKFMVKVQGCYGDLRVNLLGAAYTIM